MAKTRASLLDGLSPEARLALQRLCVVRGPVPAGRIDRGAAAELEARMLIERREPDRFEVHDVVREIVAAALGDEPLP